MLELNFTKSPDIEICGKYVTHKAKFSLGSDLSNDIVINDPQVAKAHLSIERIAEEIKVCTLSDSLFYHVNRKKISGQRAIKLNDEIKIGDTHFVISNMVDLKKPFTAAMLEKNYEKIIDEKPYVAELLDSLREELLYLEMKQNQLGKK
ncbi:MAG: FHA domain-containing protein [Bacteriovoracaceae bacterium]|nr:FHA domain-containing protein [Bacteriovoracaceae bacterium]